MAHTKSQGSSTNGRDSAGKRLGIKMFDGQFAKSGNILVRQRGLKVKPGINVKRGKDDTLFSISDGIVKFITKGSRRFKYVNIIKNN